MFIRLLLLITIIPIVSFGQVVSPTNPYTKDFVKPSLLSSGLTQQSALQQAPRLSAIEKAFDSYWEGQDYTAKGSGYKPFKRWLNHWQDYLQEDGTIAPPEVMWEAWKRKQQAESKQNPFGVPENAVINWTNIGPAVVTNSSASISGQGRINTIIKDPNHPQTLYVGAPAGGIWKSTDDGANWTPLSDNLPQIGVSGIAIDPTNSNTIYIATGDDDAGDSYSVGVMKSTDAGQTWHTTGLTYLYTNYKTTNEIFIDPTNHDHIWVASTDGLQKSENGGDTWVIKQTGNIVDFRLHPNYASNSIMYAVGYQGGESKFYRSADKGETFAEITSIPSNANRIVLETSLAAPDKVYVLSAYDNGDGTYAGSNSFQGIYVSNDAGLNFSKTAENDDIFGSAQSWYDMALTVSDTDPDLLFVGVLNIWKSTDGGNDFSQLNAWYQRTSSFTHADIHFLRYFDGVLYAGTDGGVYRSSNDGVDFEDLSNTLSIAQVYTVSTSRPDSSKLASGLQDCGGFALSGTNWNSYHGGDGMGTAVDPFEDSTYYGMTQNGGYLYRTKTAGIGGWSNQEYITTGPVDGEWITPMEFSKSGHLYAGYDQLYMLEDAQWKKLSNHPFGRNLRLITIDPNQSNIIYVATLYDVYKSTDGGVHFSKMLSATSWIRDIEIHRTNSNQVWVLSSGTLYSSTDQGQNFSANDTGLESARTIKHQQYSSTDALYLGTILGVYYTDSEVNGWHSISSDLPNVKVSDMEINPHDNILTVSTYGRGIWQTPIPAVDRPNHDVDLIFLQTQIESEYRCQNMLIPTIKVYNNGTETIDAFSYETFLNGVSKGISNWTGNLEAGKHTDVQLNALQDPIVGNNTIVVSLSLPSETLTTNNSIDRSFVVNEAPNDAGQNNLVYSFEDTDEDWLIVGDPVWEKGVPQGELLNNVQTGTGAYATNLSGDYPANASSSLVSPCYDLSVLQSGRVLFYLDYELETNFDYLYFEYSADSGLNWVSIDDFNGISPEMTAFDYPLTQDMLQDNIIFRFRLYSDNGVETEGAVIDDFQIEGVALSLDNDFGQFVSLYPNPTQGIFTIDTAGEFQIDEIHIFRTDSKQVLDLTSVKNSRHTIDLSTMAKGVYFVEIIANDKRKLIRKLIIN